MADQEHFVPPTMMGVVYWKDNVLGVLDEHGDAEAAVAALVESGFADDDAKVWTGQFVTENHEYYLKNRGRLRSLGALISSEEGDVMDDYVAEAAQGRSIVTVHAADATAARRVAQVLREQGAHHLVHYRANTLVNL